MSLDINAKNDLNVFLKETETVHLGRQVEESVVVCNKST